MSAIEDLQQQVATLKYRLAQAERTFTEVTEADIIEIANNNNVGDLITGEHTGRDVMQFAMAVAGFVQRQNDPWLVRIRYTSDPWVPFEDKKRLPREGEQIIFRDMDGSVGLGYYMSEDAAEWIGHWMAIPK